MPSSRGFLPRFPFSVASLVERHRSGSGRRTTGLVLALIAEGLLALLVLSFGSSLVRHESEKTTIVNLRAREERQASKKPDDTKKPTENTDPAKPASSERNPPKAVVAPPTTPPPAGPIPPMIRISPKEMAASDIAALPKHPGPPAASRPMMGPPDTGLAVRDTPRVGGSGPNGEPLYAAAWYREPYDDELTGYLSTATGPGWGLIACRTAPDFRVEDCIKLDEYPTGSNIARSVLAAAWQFRVRPPRIGGVSKIGEWVRIRIDYDLRRETASGRYHN